MAANDKANNLDMTVASPGSNAFFCSKNVFPFLQLPAELRCLIYDVLGLDAVHLRANRQLWKEIDKKLEQDIERYCGEAGAKVDFPGVNPYIKEFLRAQRIDIWVENSFLRVEFIEDKLVVPPPQSFLDGKWKDMRVTHERCIYAVVTWRQGDRSADARSAISRHRTLASPRVDSWYDEIPLELGDLFALFC